MKLPFLIIVFVLTLMSWSELHARLLVSVTVPAQAWLVKQLAGDQVDILTMIPAGHVAETSQPGPRTLARSREADIHFIVGHPALFFETRYITGALNSSASTNGQLNIVDMYELAQKSISVNLLSKSDPHLWTSPSIMKATATAFTNSLLKLNPGNANLYQAKLTKLNGLLDSVDAQIRAAVELGASNKLLVYHPAWGHFARDYKLQQIAVEKEGKAPAAGDLTRIVNVVKRNGLHYIISSPGAEARRASLLSKQLGIDALKVDPMDDDWLRMMQGMVKAVENKNEK